MKTSFNLITLTVIALSQEESNGLRLTCLQEAEKLCDEDFAQWFEAIGKYAITDGDWYCGRVPDRAVDLGLADVIVNHGPVREGINFYARMA